MVAALPPAIEAGELVRLQTRRHVVALTFDGGGNADGAKAILATLRKERVRATFFLTGRFARTYPAIARAIGRRYLVGNHTVDHPHLTAMSNGAVTREIVQANVQLGRATGQDTRPLFRFPYGDRDARTIAICNNLGYVSVRWTVDTWGWMGRARQSVPGAIGRVEDNLVPGEIVLMHVGSAPDRSTIDTRALPAIIRTVRSRGYRFVALRDVRGPR